MSQNNGDGLSDAMRERMASALHPTAQASTTSDVVRLAAQSGPQGTSGDGERGWRPPEVDGEDGPAAPGVWSPPPAGRSNAPRQAHRDVGSRRVPRGVVIGLVIVAAVGVLIAAALLRWREQPIGFLNEALGQMPASVVIGAAFPDLRRAAEVPADHPVGTILASLGASPQDLTPKIEALHAAGVNTRASFGIGVALELVAGSPAGYAILSFEPRNDLSDESAPQVVAALTDALGSSAFRVEGVVSRAFEVGNTPWYCDALRHSCLGGVADRAWWIMGEEPLASEVVGRLMGADGSARMLALLRGDVAVRAPRGAIGAGWLNAQGVADVMRGVPYLGADERLALRAIGQLGQVVVTAYLPTGELQVRVAHYEAPDATGDWDGQPQRDQRVAGLLPSPTRAVLQGRLSAGALHRLVYEGILPLAAEQEGTTLEEVRRALDIGVAVLGFESSEALLAMLDGNLLVGIHVEDFDNAASLLNQPGYTVAIGLQNAERAATVALQVAALLEADGETVSRDTVDGATVYGVGGVWLGHGDTSVQWAVWERHLWISTGQNVLSDLVAGRRDRVNESRTHAALHRYLENEGRTGAVYLGLDAWLRLLAAAEGLVLPSAAGAAVFGTLEAEQHRQVLHLTLSPPLLAWIASLTESAFGTYRQRSRTSEATMNLRRIFDSSTTYFATDWVGPDGQRLPYGFPASTPLTPPLPARCSADARTTPGRVWAENSTWTGLNFAISDPHYYHYQYDSRGVGNTAEFTASAFGDLDGDCTFSTFVRFGRVENMEVVGSAGLYIMNELE